MMERWKEGKGGRKGGRGREGRRKEGTKERVFNRTSGFLSYSYSQFMTELSVVCPLVVWFNEL